MPGAGCSVPVGPQRWDTFPRSAADRPAAVHCLFYCFHPLPPQARPGSLLPSPGLEPSWALGARVTVSGLAGPRPGLCQLAIAAATSHYLAWPARKRVLRPLPSQWVTPMAEGGGRKKTQALPRPCNHPRTESRLSAPSWDTCPVHQAKGKPILAWPGAGRLAGEEWFPTLLLYWLGMEVGGCSQ